jgi:hypothetical protein
MDAERRERLHCLLPNAHCRFECGAPHQLSRSSASAYGYITMHLEVVPILQIERDLYRIPRGWDRFNAYLRTMVNADSSDLRLPPLTAMNPMGKDHVLAALDALLTLDADGIAVQAVAEASNQLTEVPGEFKVGLVVADDTAGGWTNRYTSEFISRFENRHAIKRGWLSVILWTSEAVSIEAVRQEVLMTVYRAAYVEKHGFACTLREMLAQEGYVMAMAGCEHQLLTSDDIAYTREVIAPHLNAQDRPTLIACLFGDTAARALGYSPQGLSERAGLALALHDARSGLSVTS